MIIDDRKSPTGNMHLTLDMRGIWRMITVLTASVSRSRVAKDEECDSPKVLLS